jgi:hypothetical protein
MSVESAVLMATTAIIFLWVILLARILCLALQYSVTCLVGWAFL